MAEYKTNAQVNYGWGLSLNMTGKAPAIAKRIFATLADAQTYVDDAADSAIAGLQLSVINDTDTNKNGIYFVSSIGNGTNPGVLTKVGSSDAITDLTESVDQKLEKKVDKVTGKGLSTNDYTTAEKNKLNGIANGAQVNVIETVKVNGTALTPDSNKAVNVTVQAPTVTDVKTGDKILTLTNKELSTTLNLVYDSTAKTIKLLGKNNEVIGTPIDATAFIKDGMLNSAELVTNPSGQKDGTYLKLVFNTDAGHTSPMFVNVTSLIDIYTAGSGITITNNRISVDNTSLKNDDTAVANQFVTVVKQTNGIVNVTRRALTANDIPTISVAKLSDLDATKPKLSTSYTKATSYTSPTAGESIEAAIGKLSKGVDDAKTSGVTSFGGATGVVTVDTTNTTNGKVKFEVTNKKLTGTVNGLKSAAYSDASAFDAAGEASTAKSEVVGGSGDAKTANTIYGTKAYADSVADTALENAKTYANGLAGNYATKAQGTKADTALQSITKGTDGSYVTTAVSTKGSGTSQSIGVSVTVQTINTADSSHKGLAESSDVKSYINTALSWVQF